MKTPLIILGIAFVVLLIYHKIKNRIDKLKAKENKIYQGEVWHLPDEIPREQKIKILGYGKRLSAQSEKLWIEYKIYDSEYFTSGYYNFNLQKFELSNSFTNFKILRWAYYEQIMDLLNSKL